MRVLHLASCFLWLAIISSGLAWLGGINAGLFGVCSFLYVLGALAWIAIWIIDEPIQQYLRVSEETYNGALLGGAIAVVLGGLARPCLILLT